MKKLFYALGAVALMGLSTACIDQIEQNPNYDPAKDVVNTQFVLNIATDASNVQTKQTANAVQVDGNFRGLNNASLLTFQLLNDGNMITSVDSDPNTTDPMTKATSYINLSSLLGPGVIDPNGNGATVPKSRRILSIGLPIGTNTLVFYGQAITGNTEDEKNKLGYLDYDAKGLENLNLNEIGCWAVDRLPESEDVNSPASDFHRIEAIFEAMYNNLFKVEIQIPAGDYGIFDEIEGKTISWAQYSVAWDAETNQPGVSPIPGILNYGKESGLIADQPAAEFEKTLAKAYQAFTIVRTNELRAGSGAYIFRQFEDLYKIINEALSSDPLNDLEEIAQNEFIALRNYLLMFLKPNDQGSAIESFRPITSSTGETNVLSSLQTVTGKTFSAPYNSKYTLSEFPFHFNLPFGSACMDRYTAADQIAGDIPQGYSVGDFYYQAHTIKLKDGSTMSVHDYTYPPSLVYFGNSPVRISNSNNLTEDDYLDGAGNGTTEWQYGNWNANWLANLSHVVAATRGVAMVNNIQYGNAMLETKIKYSNDVLTSSSGVDKYGLADNSIALNHDMADNVFYVDQPLNPEIEDAEKYIYPSLQLTGVMVAGQPSRVGWNYMPTEGATFTKMVYDKAVSDEGTYDQETESSSYYINIPNTKGEEGPLSTPPCYTLLFDNYGSNNPHKDKVLICLEFKNLLGKDFWGNANMVRNGGSFYLLGELEIYGANNSIAHGLSETQWKAITKRNRILPPYKEVADETYNHTQTGDDYLRVFIQDCMTKATFVIGHDSLKHAYVTVPDLRSSSLSFGLSVDLDWAVGIDFGDIVL